MPCQCGCGTATTDEQSERDVTSESCGCDSTAFERERKIEQQVAAELDQRLSELEARRELAVTPPPSTPICRHAVATSSMSVPACSQQPS